jgi:hypothetical protein
MNEIKPGFKGHSRSGKGISLAPFSRLRPDASKLIQQNAESIDFIRGKSGQAPPLMGMEKGETLAGKSRHNSG